TGTPDIDVRRLRSHWFALRGRLGRLASRLAAGSRSPVVLLRLPLRRGGSLRAVGVDRLHRLSRRRTSAGGGRHRWRPGGPRWLGGAIRGGALAPAPAAAASRASRALAGKARNH